MNDKIPSPTLDDLVEKLHELEMKLAFQDDTIDTLNDQVSQQAQDIQNLWTANKLLKQSLAEAKSLGNEDNAPEPPPPHY